LNRKLISNSNYVLRKVINSKDNIEILKNFIEAILNIKIDEIKLNPYLEKREHYLPHEENFGVADVRVKTNENEEINVGIQFLDGIYYIQTKMLMYYAQIHLNQLEYEDKREFARTATINIIDFGYFSSSEYDKTIRVGTNEGNMQLEELEMHVIELPKYTCENIESMSPKDEWISYLKGGNKKTLEKIIENNKYIKQLDELLEKYWYEEKME
jgi:predicted transposase/invertase (TIGR01784 family)